MLTTETIARIEKYVHEKPRTMQEISQLLQKNWRTADRYVEEIVENIGSINTRTFREGTKGAIKIVYYAGIEHHTNTIFQEELEKLILNGQSKDDFSSFDIYQHINDKHKHVSIATNEKNKKTNQEFVDLLSKAKKEVLLFSGNLTYIDLPVQDGTFFEAFKILVKKGISIKILCRVDLIGRTNIQKMLSLNYAAGKELVEIHHRCQPVRGGIIDHTGFRLKEHHKATGYANELEKDITTFYTISDKEWTEWLRAVFWKMYMHSLDAQKRLEEINKFKP